MTTWPALLPLLLLLGCAGAEAEGSARLARGVTEEEAYDAPPYRPITSTINTHSHHPCSGADHHFYGGQWAQLFTPRRVPWAYTGVSFSLDYNGGKPHPPVATARGEVQMHAAEVPPGGGPLRPGDLLASVAFGPKQFNYTPGQWATVDLGATPLVAWERGVFIGIKWWSCEIIGTVTSTGLNVGRLVYIWQEQFREWQICHGSNFTQGLARALALRATGMPLNTGDPATAVVPPTWVCSRGEYGDSVCSCNCGAWDPACTLSPRSPNCSAHSICDSSARCEERRYWAYDGCQCECGGDTDPDCFDPFATVSACHGRFSVPVCALSDGAQSATPDTVCRETWHCDQSRYNDGYVCDCECGTMDPDCETGVANETTCPNNWKCIKGFLPAEWKCSASNYNDRIVCDCNCGAYDPDCDMKLLVSNCPQGQVCGYDAQCSPSGTHPAAQSPARDSTRTTAAISGGVGGGCLLVIVVAAIVAVAAARRMRSGPRPLNMPKELKGPAVQFVPCESVGESPGAEVGVTAASATFCSCTCALASTEYGAVAPSVSPSVSPFEAVLPMAHHLAPVGPPACEPPAPQRRT
eukprot:m51a1_g230 hypothetical protein (581) ;mRNA; f:102482-105359